MCGIVGIRHWDGTAACPRRLQRMVEQLEHRGPDATGLATDGGTGLGHTRLSIIDLRGGGQPMHSRSRLLTVVFNGEIFNYIELRELLSAKGHCFRTHSDTEVILHAYQEYGTECVRHFNGQWAFALWDHGRQRLLLSRDRLGVRPLYYARHGQCLMFASEVKALFVHPELPRELDPHGMDQLLTFWSTVPPTTVFRGVQELPPGHNLLLEDGQIRIMPYWQLDFSQGADPMPAQACADELLDLLADATRLRLRSDVPVGAYLSGGLDSSVTTALIQRCGGSRLRTFSVTFADRQFDESEFQNEVVAFLGTEHQSIHCSHDAIAGVFPDVIRHTEKPVLRTAPAPLFLLSRLVHECGYKVVLTGEGADEMLGGYDLFKEAKVRRFCAAQPNSTLRPLLLRKLYPYLANFQAQSLAYQQAFFHVRAQDLTNPFFSHLPRWNMTAQLKRFLSAEFR
ncbi:MAG: asparagine synthase (glutamine-hydrolyzing), partial [Planctomycetes bacterium RBG_16_64_10]